MSKVLSAGGVSRTWTWYGDGESVVTGKGPYSEDFTYDEQVASAYERTLRYLEERGFCMMRLSDSVYELEKAGVKPRPLPPLLDGSWNMLASLGSFVWMGDYRSPYERGCYIRSLTYRSRKPLLAAETLENI